MIILAWLRFEKGILDLTSAQIEASVVQLKMYPTKNMWIFNILIIKENPQKTILKYVMFSFIKKGICEKQ